jgi:hypothetical protein
MTTTMTNSLGMKRQAISGILIGALWIWDTLAMGMVSSWRSLMLDRTGSSLEGLMLCLS